MSGKSDRDRRQRIAIVLILLLLSGILFFFRLGTPGLFDADEPAYAQAAREMLTTGDWITPHFNGRPRSCRDSSSSPGSGLLACSTRTSRPTPRPPGRCSRPGTGSRPTSTVAPA